MIDWLLETLLWTAGLIALVLVIRRPIARIFGPQLAYALWALPVLRLILPPITLPAWMAPAGEAVEVVAEPAAAAADVPVQFVMPVGPADPAATNWIEALPLVEIAIAIWLAGAAYFLFSRFSNYARMREDMLLGARTVGRTENIRLIETPATSAPLAFGVTDKIVALPIGFMAQPDLAARDLALEHELAHHRGRDLLVNFAVQPLFALHWFNPLGYLGWLALRRDQEAACDARVMQWREPEERAVYANVIASFAAGPQAALAAPMACPVLGDKSVIHRLRSLKMSQLSNRRRLAGRGLVAAALVALPMTASISYAEVTVPAPPPPPAAPAAPGALLAPGAPPAPVAPTSAPAPLAPQKWQAIIDLDSDLLSQRATFSFHDPDEDEEVAVSREARREVHRKVDRRVERNVERKVMVNGEERELTAEERAELRRELQDAMREMDEEVREAMQEYREAMRELKNEMREVEKIKVECGDGDVRQEFKSADGKKHVTMCDSTIHASALAGLKQARADIVRQRELSRELRAEILRDIDVQIARSQAHTD